MEEQCASLSDLPEALLQDIARRLDAAELAKLCVQDTRLRKLASQQELWEQLALARWPCATVIHCGGDWQLLYRYRNTLPGTVVACVDKCHAWTARAAAQQLRMNGSSLPAMTSPAGSPAGSPVKANVYGFSQRPFASIPGMLFDQVMQSLFDLHLCQAQGGIIMISSSVHQAALASEMRLVREDMAWWLSCKPEAVFSFARRTSDLLGEWDMWGSGYPNWPEVLWRRSALQFLYDYQLGPEVDVCPSVTSRLEREMIRLDEVMHSVDAEASNLAVRPPRGLSTQHWWYWLQGQTS